MDLIIAKDSEEEELFFTVFTPTYNRATTLSRVYNSLKNQTYRNFEWLIIDDGSTDGTGDLVNLWQAETDFPIIYKWKVNEGKHIAYNLAAKIAKGRMFIGIDSDDELFPQSLEQFKFYWNSFTSDQKQTIAGIYYPGVDQSGKLVGTLFPQNRQIDDFVKILWKFRIQGDKGAFWQTRVLRMYPFPEHLKNVIVPEGILIHQMSKDWKVAVVNEPLFKIWINEDQRHDHLSTQSTLPKNYPGQLFYNMVLLNYSLRHFKLWPKIVCGAAFRYAKLSFLTNQDVYRQYKNLRPFFAKFLWIIFMPLAYISNKTQNKQPG